MPLFDIQKWNGQVLVFHEMKQKEIISFFEWIFGSLCVCVVIVLEINELARLLSLCSILTRKKSDLNVLKMMAYSELFYYLHFKSLRMLACARRGGQSVCQVII